VAWCFLLKRWFGTLGLATRSNGLRTLPVLPSSAPRYAAPRNPANGIIRTSLANRLRIVSQSSIQAKRFFLRDQRSRNIRDS
jgi:hypothetical protein